MLLNNRYRIIRTLGSGGFGETFLAEDTQMPSLRRCVIKQLKPIHNKPQIYQLVQERFGREAAILEELGGANDQIPALYAYFQLDGQFYLVQEWIEGETLTATRRQGLLSESAVREILVNLLPVLDYIHSKGIVHRDIKPDNIILRYRDGKPVLIDFGAVRETMATVMNSQGSPTSSIVIGTPGFMPSEQAIGRPVYASDLYSLGITAIYLLTGKQPQQLQTDADTVEIVWHSDAVNVSPTMAAVIDKAIAYHPRDRYPNAKAMLMALQSEANTIPPTQPPTVSTPPQTVSANISPSAQDRSRNRVLMGSAIGGSLIAAVIIGFIFTNSSQPSKEQSVAKTASSEAEATSPSPKPLPENQTSPSKVSTPTLPDTSSANLPNSFYFLADSAFPNTQTAGKQIKTLQASGYPQAGMFWIPDYPNLSGKQLFEVYTAKFGDRNSCIDSLKIYGKVNSKAYCAFASKNPNDPTQRLYFKQISTISTPDSTSTPSVATTTLNDYSWLSQRVVTDADLDGKDGFQLDIMRNSIFAVHGRRFDTSGLQDYFNKQPWYRPLYSPQEFDKLNLLSDLEKQNAAYIDRYQTLYNRRYFKK